MPKKQYIGTIDIDLTVGLIVIGLLAALFVPRWVYHPLGIFKDNGFVVVVGFLCVVTAKISLFRRGVWGSWGSGKMTTGWARLYKLGYVLIGVGVISILSFYWATR
jgi:hypothetical protein